VSPAALRTVLRIVAAAGIPGIIVGSIAGNDAVALVFGSITATAAFGLIVLTAATSSSAPTESDEEIGESVEAKIAELVASGADEDRVRGLVADAVRLGAQSRARDARR